MSFFGMCRLDMTKGWRLQGNNNKCHQTPWRPNASHHLQPLKAIPVHIIPLAYHNNNQVHEMPFSLNHHPHAWPTLLRLYQQHQIPPNSQIFMCMCVCTRGIDSTDVIGSRITWLWRLYVYPVNGSQFKLEKICPKIEPCVILIFVETH
jgi:hypothetical protein